MGRLRTQLKGFAYRTPLARFLCPRYIYNFEPAQLAFLVECLDRTRDLPGPVLEIGCYVGSTTVFLNRHMDCAGIEKPYFALDTFAGFTPADVEHEVTTRGKRTSVKTFSENSQAWFDRTMELNGIRRVTSVKADASQVDYARYRHVSFALVDVDLYVPVKAALERITPQMAPRGIIVVDDCVPNSDTDGAHQAYVEFVRKEHRPETIVHGKLGVIEIGA